MSSATTRFEPTAATVTPLRRGGTRTVVLGVAASDAHAVANHLIAHELRSRGYAVDNIGPCSTVAEFAAHCDQDTLAVVIGSLNGQVHEDLSDLPDARTNGAIDAPVIVGGNLSVGSHKDADASRERLYALGVDHVLDELSELFELLTRLDSVPARPSQPAPTTRAS